MNQHSIEKISMQNLIDGIVSQGAFMFENPDSNDRNIKTCVDCIKILTATPYSGEKYSTHHYYFWAVCYGVGFDKHGPQSVCTLKMEMIREYGQELRFKDQHGNEIVIEPIDQDDELTGSIYRRWLAYKEKKADILRRLYEDYNSEALETIRYWESGI
jgi:hypothetical protein